MIRLRNKNDYFTYLLILNNLNELFKNVHS